MTILYTTGCPQCNVLKAKLKAAQIDYTEISDSNEIMSKGIMKVPVLEVDGVMMGLSEANTWIKNRRNQSNEHSN